MGLDRADAHPGEEHRGLAAQHMKSPHPGQQRVRISHVLVGREREREPQGEPGEEQAEDRCGPGIDAGAQQGQVAQAGPPEGHLGAALAAEDEMDRLFVHPQAHPAGADQDLRQEGEAGAPDLDPAHHRGLVEAEAGGLVPDADAIEEAHQHVDRPGQEPLPDRSPLDPAGVQVPRPYEDVAARLPHAGEEAGDLLRLVVEVRVHGDDEVGAGGHRGEPAAERGAQTGRLRAVEDANAGDLAGEPLQDLPRPVPALHHEQHLPLDALHTLEGDVETPGQGLDRLLLVVGGDDRDDPGHVGSFRPTTTK